jgi:hypothetical protein
MIGPNIIDKGKNMEKKIIARENSFRNPDMQKGINTTGFSLNTLNELFHIRPRTAAFFVLSIDFGRI